MLLKVVMSKLSFNKQQKCDWKNLVYKSKAISWLLSYFENSFRQFGKKSEEKMETEENILTKQNFVC